MRQLVSWNLYVFYGLYLSNENGPTSYKLCPNPIVEFVFGVKGITIGCSRCTATIYNNLVVYRQHFLWFELVSTPSQTEEKGQIFSVSMTLLITPLILYHFFTIYQHTGMLEWRMKKVSLPATYFLLCWRWPFTLILALPGAYCFLRNRLIHHLTWFCKVMCETTPQNASSDLFWCDVA